MIGTDELEIVTCLVSSDSGKGTAIFVAKGVLLTCRHVVEDLTVNDEIQLSIKSGTPFKARIGPVCTKTDLALLYTDYDNIKTATLIDCEVLQGIPYASHGHPDTINGNTVGEQLHGTVTHFETTIVNEHDVSLSAGNLTLNAQYRGYSGSGVINSKKEVFAIMRYRNDNYLSAVSIRKAAEFLTANNIKVEDAVLGDFGEYLNSTFNSLHQAIREHCIRNGRTVSKNVTPQQLLNQYKGNLIYPGQVKSVKDMVTMLMQHNNLNTGIWQSWLRLLTYVLMTGGDISDISKITLPLGDILVTELGGEEVDAIVLNVTVTLNLYFTENTDFDSITCEYLYEKFDDGQISDKSCHVFDSVDPMFGHKLLSANKKRSIVGNIASGGGGYNVPGALYFGVISLMKLNSLVGDSDEPAEVKIKFKQILTDVLKTS